MRKLPKIIWQLALAVWVPLLITSTADAETIVIRGGTIHTMVGPPIVDGQVIIENDRIVSVGKNLSIPTGAREIDATRSTVFPAFLDAYTHLGLRSPDPTHSGDTLELGRFNSELIAADAIDSQSGWIARARIAGIGAAIVLPDANSGGIGGQAAAVSLSEGHVDDLVISRSVGLTMVWPSRADPKYHALVGDINDLFARAGKWKPGNGSTAGDNEMIALNGALAKSRLVVVQAGDVEGELDVIQFAQAHQLKLVFLNPVRVAQITKLLVKNDVAVVLSSVKLWKKSNSFSNSEGFDASYRTPSLLYKAGVKFAIAQDDRDIWRLPQNAAVAVAYGLPWIEAIKAVTRYPAEIFGIDRLIGSILPGRLANLVIVDGDPLEATTHIEIVIIRGNIYEQPSP